MNTKSQQTYNHILSKVSPIFNKLGYDGTSMSDLTKATGLTKGAIYGHFKNKEELALLAFNYNIKKTIGLLSQELSFTKSAVAQLYCITNFFRRYHLLIDSHGGCPIINIGIDSNFKNSKLQKRVTSVINKLEKSIADIVTNGIETKEINPNIKAEEFASLCFSMIEGSIFMSMILKDYKYILLTTDNIDRMIRTELILK